MSKKTNEWKIIENVSAGKFVSDGYTRYGIYVNLNRHIPSVYDGLKPSYRRAIYAILTTSGNKFMVTHNALGAMMKYHPHSTDGTADAISELVRYGVLDGSGNHGSESMLGDKYPHSATRYTKVRVSDQIRNLLSPVLKLVPYLSSEVDGDDKEPEYLPLPVPISLICDRVFGLGIGVSTLMPTFSMKSLIDAYINDDYKLLRYRSDIIIDQDESDLEKLWKVGYGRVTYKYDVKLEHRKVTISGDPSRFQVRLPNEESNDPDDITFNTLRSQGRIYIDDLSDKNNIGLLEIGATHGSRIDFDWLFNYCKKISTLRETYFIRVNDGKKVFQIGIRDWMDRTFNNYIELFNTNKNNLINNQMHQLNIYKELPKVVEYFLKNTNASDEEVAKNADVDINIVKEVMKKPISVLKKTNADQKILSILDKIDELNKLNPRTHILDNLI